jgi:DNA-binding transcriptional MerR regulator
VASLTSARRRGLRGRGAGTSTGTSLYSIAQASEISGIPGATLRRWFTAGLAWASAREADPARAERRLTVADLLSLTTLRRLRTAGLSMKRASAIMRTLHQQALTDDGPHVVVFTDGTVSISALPIDARRGNGFSPVVHFSLHDIHDDVIAGIGELVFQQPCGKPRAQRRRREQPAQGEGNHVRSRASGSKRGDHACGRGSVADPVACPRELLSSHRRQLRPGLPSERRTGEPWRTERRRLSRGFVVKFGSGSRRRRLHHRRQCVRAHRSRRARAAPRASADEPSPPPTLPDAAPQEPRAFRNNENGSEAHRTPNLFARVSAKGSAASFSIGAVVTPNGGLNARL